ncbi:hypothetical protein M2650_06525 [Luteimonas sp. SX5]|uniref:Uncharacterized protein n=1 Tax=Luteimonas galliterrae TaxID=2940486 RepID=A0ABT0MHD0_9GAMM|nr:hypothetical protein [Luteimonas galliterrae]MCL1634287.1 hypothetical protein [Luteimonas galliterrae]
MTLRAIHAFTAVTILLLLVWRVSAHAAPADAEACPHDRTHLLSLDEDAFDQDLSNGGGGWRALASKPGCETVAADLIRDYRQAHNNEAGILFWHEAQLRASAGEYAQTIPLMERSRKPADQDRGGWNPYVDATLAFLRKDRAAIGAAREQLSKVAPPPGEKISKDGFMELSLPDGQKMKMRWPPNLDVVDGLIRCFDKPYDVAYGNECRSPAKP